MGIQELQKFIETHCPTACVPVDLLKIARSVGVRRTRPTAAQGGGNGSGHHRGQSGANNQTVHNHNNNSGRLCLVVDGECCLDRLYGGFFSDWVCGGQWNRMVQFLAVLIQTIQNNNIELAVFFNGSLESQRMDEWIKGQQNERKKIAQVLKHLEMKGTPPPKVWWIPPVCLTTCLRMALRHLNITVLSTMDDHHQEVIAYCRENGFHGLMAEDAEYAIFDPPRYFSSEQLKLTYKGSLETKEFILDEVAKQLNLHPNRFCIFATLLGNYLLTEEDLVDFYATLSLDTKNKAPGDSLIQAVCDFVRALPPVDNLDAIGAQIFGNPVAVSGTNASKINSRIQKFKECVQYYLNGTKDGFLRYRSPNIGRKSDASQYVPTWSAASVNPCILHNDTAKFASETQESELSSLSAYKEATGGYSIEGLALGNPNKTSKSEDTAATVDDSAGDQNLITGSTTTTNTNSAGTKNATQNSTASGKGISNTAQNQESSNGASNRTATAVSGGYPYQPQPAVYLPPVPPEVMRTACERHQKGLMSPWIYQVLSQGEIKLPACLEEDVPFELPASAFLYRPIRQMVYAILFNMHHLQFQAKQKMELNAATSSSTGLGSCDGVPDILVKEWVWTKYNQYRNPDLVKAEALGWPVPTVQRLWFGSTMDDKKRRLRAFLTCMHSDTPLMLNTVYVPQHLLVMCCVLRYVLAQSEHRILRRQELNAFLAQAVSPRLMDAQAMQAMQLPVVSARGVQLASLFMRGVECALFANDACGAPIPWLMCCPWLFFDGKLFHFKLLKAEEAKNLLELCEGQTDQVLKVERMRQAILKGLKVEFARPPLPVTSPARIPGFAPPPPTFMPAGNPSWPVSGRGRGTINAAGRRAVLARGGQLEIAGVVVGSWGPNYGTGLSGRSGMHMAPQVTSVGGPRKGKGPYLQKYGGALGGSGGSGAGSGGSGGGGGGFAPIGVNRGFPTYSIRRPPTRVRRPAGNQFQANRKARKSKGSGGATAGGAKTNSHQSGGGTANSAGSSSARSGIGRGCTIQSGSKSVPVSQIHDNEANATTAQSTVDEASSLVADASADVPATEDQFEDAGTDIKTLKPSPTIMKKPSDAAEPVQLDVSSRNGNETDGVNSDNGVSVSQAD